MSAACADGRRDALAILAAALAGDEEGASIVAAHCDLSCVIGTLGEMLCETLAAQDADAAEWVAAQQACMRAELGGG